MEYDYIIAETAQKDYESIIEYLLQNTSKDYALKIGRAIKDKISTVRKQPYMYQVKQKKWYKILGVRQIPVSGYVIFYRIDEEKRLIHICRIRSDKQDNRKLKIQ